MQQPDLAGKVLDVAGEEDLSGADIARIFSQKLSADIKHVGVSAQKFGNRLKQILDGRASKELATLYKFTNENDGAMLRKDYDQSRRLLSVKLEPVGEWADRAFAPQKASKDYENQSPRPNHSQRMRRGAG